MDTSSNILIDDIFNKKREFDFHYDFHPTTLLFGATRSGKSILLMNLMSYYIIKKNLFSEINPINHLF